VIIPTTSEVTTTTTTTTSPASERVPGSVAVLTAGAGGGSGEVQLDWDGISGANGYRVYRAAATGGPFSVSADVNLTTGRTTVESGVTNIWSDTQNFYPLSSTAGAERSLHFHYVEILSGSVYARYFRVIAYNSGGDGPASVVVCGAPSGNPQC
jgi:hypothetical protein